MNKANQIKQGLCFFSNQQKYNSTTLFDQLFTVFRELLMMTGGDVSEALQWLNDVDRKYQITKSEFGISDFIKELELRGFLQRDKTQKILVPTRKMDANIRQSSFDELFGKIRKVRPGRHHTKFDGLGSESALSSRPFEFGDRYNNIDSTESIQNALINHGIDSFQLDENDLMVRDNFYQSNCSTVLMIDISHSMILYGEDRITPAKKVALALSQLIHHHYPNDSLNIIVFGDDAWEVQLKDLPYLQVGPYHTNTIAGLDLAYQILLQKKNPNKNIMIITDGKPTCMKRGGQYYKNSFGLDRQIVNRTISAGVKCHKQGIDLTTFMVTSDPYLVEFVELFSRRVHGKAYYTNLDGLGEEILINYEKNRKKTR